MKKIDINELKNFKFRKMGVSIYYYLEKSIIRWLSIMDEKTIIREIQKDIDGKKRFKLTFSVNNMDMNFYDDEKEDHYYSEASLRNILTVLSSLMLIEKNNDEKYIINKELIDLKQERKSKKSIEIVQEFIINKLEFCLEENIWKNLNKEINTQIKNNNNTSRDFKRSNANLWYSIITTMGMKHKNKINLDWNFLRELKKSEIKGLKIEKEEVLNEWIPGYQPFIEKIFLDNKMSNELKNKFFNSINNFFINFKNLIDANKQCCSHKPLNKFELFKTEKTNQNSNKVKLEDTWENKIDFYLNDYLKREWNSSEDKIDEEIRKKEGENEEFILIKSSLKDFIISKHMNYDLPLFQRTYSWETNFISSLFYSIYNDYLENKSFTLLNSVILYQMNNKASIIDGQQRIASITMIIIALFKYSLYLNTIVAKNLLYDMIIKIANIVNSFEKNNEDYGFIFKITKSEKDKNNSLENSIKDSKFYKNWQEITKLIEKEIKDSDNLNRFCQYILNNTFFIFVYLKLKDNDHRHVTKIFNNLNKISKRIAILDLLRSKLYDEFLLNKNRNNKDYKIRDHIKIYDHTINLYFRKKNIIDGEEDIQTINDFLENSLLAKNHDDDYKTKIDEINKQHHDKWLKAFFKIDLFFDYYKKLEQKDDDIVFFLLKDIVVFEYFKYGNVNRIKKIINDLPEKEISNHIINFKKYYDKFSKNIEKLKFINNQISHISNKGKIIIFIPLIYKIANKLDFLNTIENNDIFDKIFKKNEWNEISKFSFCLSEIEKFKVLWKNIGFKGQSLRNSILKIVKELKDEQLEPFQYSLSSNLFNIIDDFSNLSNVKKIKELYEKLSSLKDNNEIFTEIFIKIDYSIELDQTYTELNNACKCLSLDIVSPQFFLKYSSIGNSEKILSNNLNDDYSYDHHLPTNASKQEKEDEDNLKNNYPHLFSNINKAKSEIGNGDLLHQKDNITKNNRKRHPITAHYKEGKKSEIFKIIDFEKLDEQSNDIYFSDSYIEIPKVVPKPENTWSKKEWENYIINVKKRSETLIKSYISIIFYDWVKNK